MYAMSLLSRNTYGIRCLPSFVSPTALSILITAYTCTTVHTLMRNFKKRGGLIFGSRPTLGRYSAQKQTSACTRFCTTRKCFHLRKLVSS